MGFTARAALIVVMVVAAAGLAEAGQARSALEGAVADSSGARLPGVTVEVTPKTPADRVVAATTTDGDGVYRVQALPPGQYIIRFTLAGFARMQVPVVVLTVERDQVLTKGFSIELQSRPRPSLSLVSGLDYYHDAVASARRDHDQATDQFRDRRGQYANGATAGSLAAFTQATMTGLRWRADAGIRLSHFEVSAPDPDFGSAGIAPTTATGSAGVSLALADGLRMFGSVAQAFRAPNIDDLSSLGQFDFGVEVPAPDLQPESSVTVEGGIKWRADAGSASVSVYRTSLDQLIDRVRGTFDGSPMIGNQPVYQKANAGSAFIRGVEADGEFRLTSSLTASGSLMYTYGQATSRNEPMRRIPPLNGLVAIRAALTGGSWLEGALRFAATQDRLASGDIADHRIPTGGTPGWTVFTISAGHRLGQRFELVGSAQNLFDTAYRTHGSGIDGYGRSLWIGLHAAFW